MVRWRDDEKGIAGALRRSDYLVGLTENHLRPVDELLQCCGDQDPPVRALEESDAKRPLELRAERRLGYVAA